MCRLCVALHFLLEARLECDGWEEIAEGFVQIKRACGPDGVELLDVGDVDMWS